MGKLANQLVAVAENIASEADVASLKRAQAAEHTRGATAGAGGEVVLLDEQRALAGAGALTGDGQADEAAADDGDLEVLSREGRASWA